MWELEPNVNLFSQQQQTTTTTTTTGEKVIPVSFLLRHVTQPNVNLFSQQQQQQQQTTTGDKVISMCLSC